MPPRDTEILEGRHSFHQPLGGSRGFRLPSIPGCQVTKFAPHSALKLIESGKLTSDAGLYSTVRFGRGPSKKLRPLGEMEGPQLAVRPRNFWVRSLGGGVLLLEILFFAPPPRTLTPVGGPPPDRRHAAASSEIMSSRLGAKGVQGNYEKEPRHTAIRTICSLHISYDCRILGLLG